MILRGQVFSQTLQMDTHIAVITPNDFDSEQPYKVVYMLHGTAGCNEDFISYTNLPLYALEYPCVFVMPNALRSLYTDMAYGQKYFTYVAEELPKIVKRIFNVSGKREDTWIIGNSSGGYGAMKIALTYPDKYGFCAANAPGAMLLESFLPELATNSTSEEMIAMYGENLIMDFRAAFGEDFDWRLEIDVLALAKRIAHPDKGPKILMQIGTADELLEPARIAARELGKLPIDFTYKETEGTHDFTFFDKAQKEAIEFALEVMA